MNALKRNDDTSRAISAFFNEIQSAAAKAATSGISCSGLGLTWQLNSAPPHVTRGSSVALEDLSEGVTLPQFCHFLGHYRCLSIDFTHIDALQVFRSASENNPDAALDLPKFREALTGVANMLRGDLSVSRRISSTGAGAPDAMSGSGRPGNRFLEESVPPTATASKTRKADALEEFLREVNLRRDATLDAEAGVMSAPLCDARVIEAIYSYGGALMSLFHHYATGEGHEAPGRSPSPSMSQSAFSRRVSGTKPREPPMVTCRSLCRLVHAIGLSPHCVVRGELEDIIACRCRIRERSTNMAGERGERHAERRYLSECRMFGSPGDDCASPAPGHLSGEPRYSFPDLVEFLAAAAFTIPPRPHEELPEVRVARIHEIFGRRLRLPKDPMLPEESAMVGPVVPPPPEVFNAQSFLEEACRLHGVAVAPASTGTGRLLSTVETEVKPPADLRDILVKLAEELPALPEKRVPKMPGPPPAKMDSLPKQPATVDELLLLPPGHRSEHGQEKKKKKGKKIIKKKAKVGPVELNKVIFYAKRPVPKKPEIPPQLRLDMRSRGLEQSDLRLLAKSLQSERLAAPEGGGLRMSFIDEPLRAPRCKLSEEVSTLMETALAARRLRHYDEAISLLIRARRLWAALEAGREVPVDWADIHPMVPAPSPWGDGPVSAAGRAERSENGNCCRGCRAPSGDGSENYKKMMEGTGVFRRVNMSCAAAHIRPRTGATAALAAAAQPSKSLASVADGSPRAMDQTILPSELEAAMRPASSRGTPSRPPTAGLPDAGALDCTISPSDFRQTSARTPSRPGTSTGHQPQPPSSARPPGSRPSPRAASAAEVRRPMSAVSMASGGSTGSRSAVGQGQLARRYDPKQDFGMATADGEEDLERLPPEAAIFFFAELASLHAAVREDDLAAQLLWRARAPTERLPSDHPDGAVVWCGLGRVAYLAGAFDVAARATLRGRKVRESTLGGDTVETATSYNNLACCFFALDRPMEALAYLELAEEILRVLVGEDHPRALTALRNLEKARSAQKHLRCEVPHLFSYYVKEFRLRGRSKKKKKGSKKGGSSKAGSSRGSSTKRSGSRKSSASSKSGKKKGKKKGR